MLLPTHVILMCQIHIIILTLVIHQIHVIPLIPDIMMLGTPKNPDIPRTIAIPKNPGTPKNPDTPKILDIPKNHDTPKTLDTHPIQDTLQTGTLLIQDTLLIRDIQTPAIHPNKPICPERRPPALCQTNDALNQVDMTMLAIHLGYRTVVK